MMGDSGREIIEFSQKAFKKRFLYAAKTIQVFLFVFWFYKIWYKFKDIKCMPGKCSNTTLRNIYST